MSDNPTISELMRRPSPAAQPVVTLNASLAERIISRLAETAPHSSELVDLRALASEPVSQLWAIHCVGPDSEYPMLSRESAEEAANKTMEVVRARLGGHFDESALQVNVIPSPWEPTEHFHILAEELDKENDRLRHALKAAKARIANLTGDPDDV